MSSSLSRYLQQCMNPFMATPRENGKLFDKTLGKWHVNNLGKSLFEQGKTRKRRYYKVKYEERK